MPAASELTVPFMFHLSQSAEIKPMSPSGPSETLYARTSINGPVELLGRKSREPLMFAVVPARTTSSAVAPAVMTAAV